MVLDWHEHLTNDEMPPEWMWPIDEAITEWMQRVKEERDEKYGTSSSSGERDEKVPMMTNELARDRR